MHTVIAIASAKAITHMMTAHIFQARCTDLLSFRSGQNRSKKKAAPNIVATAIPTKML